MQHMFVENYTSILVKNDLLFLIKLYYNLFKYFTKNYYVLLCYTHSHYERTFYWFRKRVIK